MSYPANLPGSADGYSIPGSARGHYAGFYNGAHYAFLIQSGGNAGPFLPPAYTGDIKIHALKSTDGGNTWVDQDSSNAPTTYTSFTTISGIDVGWGPSYTVAPPDTSGIVRILILVTAAAAWPQIATVSGFHAINYDLNTDTWGSLSSLHTGISMFFGTARSDLPPLDGGQGFQFCLTYRGDSDYLITYNSVETVSGVQCQRVSTVMWDGASTFGTPIMLPGQTGNMNGYGLVRPAVDARGYTHFVFNESVIFRIGTGPSPNEPGPVAVYHVGLLPGGVFTFGTANAITALYAARYSSGGAITADGAIGVVFTLFLADPVIETFGGAGTESLCVVCQTFQPLVGDGHVNVSLFIGSGIDLQPFLPTWPPDPGLLVATETGRGFNCSAPLVGAGSPLAQDVCPFSFVRNSSHAHIFYGACAGVGTDGFVQGWCSPADASSWSLGEAAWNAPTFIDGQHTSGTGNALAYVDGSDNISVIGLFAYWGPRQLAQFYLNPPSDCAPSPVNPTLACPVVSSLTIGVPYSGTLVATLGTPPYTFTITAGSLPPGLLLNSSTGAITGTPTAVGTFPYTAQVEDSLSHIGGPVNCVFNVLGGPPVPSPCQGVVPQPSTDVKFELRRVYATMVPHKRLPVRGGSGY